MTRANLIDRFKNHIKIDGKNHVAYADATLVEVFINSHIANNTLIMAAFKILAVSLKARGAFKIVACFLHQKFVCRI